MQCAEFEIRLCEYLDGALAPPQGAELERHAAQCAVCGALLADSRAATAFLERVPAVEAPPELVTRILYRTEKARTASWLAAGGWRRWLGPLLAPRLVMGMAMTILSFSMLARVAGVKVKQMEPADFHPARVWAGVENQAARIWNRGLKYYQNVRLVYEVMGQLGALTAAEETTEPGSTGILAGPDSQERQ